MDNGLPIAFAKTDVRSNHPKYKIEKQGKYVSWSSDSGKKNLYPQEILELYYYDGGTKHKMIIDKKLYYLIGNGFEDIVDPNLAKFIEDNDILEHTKKAFFDYEIINGFCFGVAWSKDGSVISTIERQPIFSYRFGLNDEDDELVEFAFCKNWKDNKMVKDGLKFVPKFDPENRFGAQLYWYAEPNELNTLYPYPVPNYSNLIYSIKTDAAILKYDYTQTINNFSSQYLIDMAVGDLPMEKKDEIVKNLNNKFVGPDADTIAVTFHNPQKGQSPISVNKIENNGSNKRFEGLVDKVEGDIVKGSHIPPQMLILTAGKLDQTGDRASLMMEFINGYITPRQKVVERHLNKLLEFAGFTEKVRIKKVLFNTDENNNVK